MTAAIRDAATVVLLRAGPGGPSVLMGQRGARAAFMPSKFVFPGGAVDPGDAAAPLAAPLGDELRAALCVETDATPEALVVAALRELGEETGQRLSRPGEGCGWPGWGGRVPDPSSLRFVFRAVTPPGRPRRFDARFFLADADALETDPDDFSRAEDELSHLRWVPLAEARRLDVPFVTEVVLGEVAAHAAGRAASGVPFLDNRGDGSRMVRL